MKTKGEIEAAVCEAINRFEQVIGELIDLSHRKVSYRRVHCFGQTL